MSSGVSLSDADNLEDGFLLPFAVYLDAGITTNTISWNNTIHQKCIITQIILQWLCLAFCCVWRSSSTYKRYIFSYCSPTDQGTMIMMMLIYQREDDDDTHDQNDGNDRSDGDDHNNDGDDGDD